MIRTIILAIWLLISLLISLPFLWRANYLYKKGKTEQAVALTHKCTQIWSKSILWVTGVKVNVLGKENFPKDKTVLVVGNHQGNFDIPIYLSQFPFLIGFIAKIEMKKVHVLTGWMNAMQSVFMDRSNLRKSSEAIIKGIKKLKEGFSIVIFPEGTRSASHKMGEFKAGSFKLATKSNRPILPVTIDGSFQVMEHGKGIWLKKANVDLYIHPLIEVEGLSKEECNELHTKVENIIKSKLPN